MPVRNVLVADASRRTRKVNAYVSGLGATRRVVLFDTLLAAGDPRQIRLVAFSPGFERGGSGCLLRFGGDIGRWPAPRKKPADQGQAKQHLADEKAPCD